MRHWQLFALLGNFFFANILKRIRNTNNFTAMRIQQNLTFMTKKNKSLLDMTDSQQHIKNYSIAIESA